MTKGENLENFFEHLLPSLDQETSTLGARSSATSRGSRRPAPVLTGSATDTDALVYYQWACRADQRMRVNLPSAEIAEEDENLDEPLPEKLPERERKQKKLWAYRQRTMNWSDPRKWTRAAFRRKLNPRFVESLMVWPPYWTSETAVLGPEVMESWQSKGLSLLSTCLGDSNEEDW